MLVNGDGTDTNAYNKRAAHWLRFEQQKTLLRRRQKENMRLGGIRAVGEHSGRNGSVGFVARGKNEALGEL